MDDTGLIRVVAEPEPGLYEVLTRCDLRTKIAASDPEYQKRSYLEVVGNREHWSSDADFGKGLEQDIQELENTLEIVSLEAIAEALVGIQLGVRYIRATLAQEYKTIKQYGQSNA